jgi:hypothetical protein
MVNLLRTPIHFAERLEDCFDHDGFLEPDEGMIPRRGRIMNVNINEKAM